MATQAGFKVVNFNSSIRRKETVKTEENWKMLVHPLTESVRVINSEGSTNGWFPSIKSVLAYLS